MLGNSRNGSVAEISPLSLTRGDIKVNPGNVYPSEHPVFLGETQLQDSRKNKVKVSISIDRDWLWLRTSELLCDAHRAALIKHGYSHGETRNGWHIPVSVETLTTLNQLLNLNLDVPTLAKFSADTTERWVKEKQDKEDERRKAEYQRLSSGRTTIQRKETEQAKTAQHEANKLGLPSDVFDPTTMKIDAGGRLRWKSNGQYVDTKSLQGKSKTKEIQATLPEANTLELGGGFVDAVDAKVEVSAMAQALRAFDHGLKVGTADRERGYVKHNDANKYKGQLAMHYINGYKEGFTPPMSEKDKAIAELQAQMKAMMAKLAELTK